MICTKNYFSESQNTFTNQETNKIMKELEIQVIEGYEFDRIENGKIVLKQSKVKPNTYGEVAKKLMSGIEGYFINEYGRVRKINGLPDEYWEDADASPTKAQLESILSLNKLCNVAKYLNGDWLPDGDYRNEWQITTDIRTGEIVVDWFSYKHGPLFKSKVLAKQAIEILGEDEIRKALTLNH